MTDLDNRAPLLKRLRDFMDGVGSRFRLVNLMLVPCEASNQQEALSGVQLLSVEGDAMARIRRGGEVETIQIVGEKDPHRIRIDDADLDLFSFQLTKDIARPRITFKLRSIDIPRLGTAARAAALLRSHLAKHGVEIEVFFFQDSRLRTPPEDLTWGSPVEDPRIGCWGTTCREFIRAPLE